MTSDSAAGGMASRRRSGLLIPGPAVTRRTELLVPEGTSFADWKRIGRQLHLIADSSSWWLADWLVFGQENYPHRYREAIQASGLDYQTLRNYAWVARRFPATRRRAKLSLGHHAEVASLLPSEQDVWLDRAEASGWSRNALRRHIRGGSRQPENGADEVDVRIKIEVTPERESLWLKAATDSGKSLAEWAIEVLDEAAGNEPGQLLG